MNIKDKSTRPICPTGFRQQDTKHEMKTPASTLLFYFLMGLMGLIGQYKDSEDLGGLRRDGTGTGQTGQDGLRRAPALPSGLLAHRGSETRSWWQRGPLAVIHGGAP
jgi:hypothetical protein